MKKLAKPVETLGSQQTGGAPPVEQIPSQKEGARTKADTLFSACIAWTVAEEEAGLLFEEIWGSASCAEPIVWDWYDYSFELVGLTEEAATKQLSDEEVIRLRDFGFFQCWLHFGDGMEVYHYFRQEHRVVGPHKSGSPKMAKALQVGSLGPPSANSEAVPPCSPASLNSEVPNV